MKKISALTLFLFTAAAQCHAALFAYDGFSASSGNLEGTGGPGWSSGGVWYNNSLDATLSYSSPGLSHAGLQVSGNKAVGTGGDAGAFRYMGTYGGDNSVTWLSLLIQVTQNPGFSYAGLSLFTGDTGEHLFIGQRFSQSYFGIEQADGNFSNTAVNSSDQGYLVAKLDMQNNKAVLWVNPSLSSEPLESSGSAITLNDFTFDTVRIQSGGSTHFAVDELRFGTAFADVAPVPEPAHYGLACAAGLLGIAWFQNWRKRRTARL